jgi:hypothetical protein
MKVCRRIATVRRQVERLAAIAAERAAEAAGVAPSFRPLCGRDRPYIWNPTRLSAAPF